jgi:hypothetical protein
MEIGFPRSPERGPIEAADLRSAPAPALRIVYSTLSGSGDRWAQVPWAAGTKGGPLPTATQFEPLRGLELFPPRTDSCCELFIRPFQGRGTAGLRFRGRRAQKACPYPRLLNSNPFGV